MTIPVRVTRATPWCFRPTGGYRLGLLLKLSMLDWLAAREPGLRRIVTGNAASNSAMIRINELLGFEPLCAYTGWQLRLLNAP